MAVLKWTGLVLLGLVLLVAAGIGVVAALYDWNDARGFLAARLGDALGRDVALDGDLHVGLGDPIRIRAEGVRIANAPWAREPALVEIGALDARLRLWPLLRGDWELPEVRLIAPKLAVERNEAGESNWTFASDPRAAAVREATAPDDRSEMPVIERLRIDDGRLRYRDATRDIDLDSTISTAVGGSGDDRVHLEGQGSFAGQPFRLAVDGGSLRLLRDGTEPYPVRAEAAVGRTRGTVEGTLAEPVRFEGVDLGIDLRGDDLSTIFPIFGIPAPQTGPYTLSGHLARDGAVWRLTGLKGRVGRSDLSGTVTVDGGGERPHVAAELVSERLALADLAGLVGAAPEGPEGYPTKEAARVLPATPVNLDRLRATDIDLRLNGRRLEAAAAALDNFAMVLHLEDGVLAADPLSFGVGDGRILGKVTLDGRRRIPSAAVDLGVRGIGLADLFEGTDLAAEMGGTVTGRIVLSGRGATVADIAAVSDGSIGLAVDGGTVGGLVVQGLQTDILETLGIVLSGDEPAPFNCFVADVAVEQGVGRVKALVLDTPETLAVGGGTVDLGVETLDLRIEGRPKEANLLSTQVPVLVHGRFAAPEIGFDPAESAARGAAAVALGVLLTPLAGLLPLLDPGTEAGPNCGTLIRRALAPDDEADGGR
ncbi:AsmA family protein [Azospirillum sp. ST 5-10]|uniref:AsmA family protein n=1 Tax=unclassified Azospirillum TaxID=2630922 RepID=UPI003F49E2C1